MKSKECIRFDYREYENLNHEEKHIVDTLDEEYDRMIKERNMYSLYFHTMIKWKKLELSDIKLSDYIKDQSVAIYGAGLVGELIGEELLRCGIDIKYYLDKNRKNTTNEIRVLNVIEATDEVDIILVSITPYADEVDEELRNLSFVPKKVVTIDDIYNEMMKRGKC